MNSSDPKAHLYLDKRHPDKDGRFTLYVAITRLRKTAMSSLNIKLTADQWVGDKVVNHPQKDVLNRVISAKLGEIDKILLEMSFSGSVANLSAREILEKIRERMEPDYAAKQKKKEEEKNSFSRFFLGHMNSIKNDGTRGLYEDTYNKIEKYCQHSGIDFETLSFSDIDVKWLRSFEQFCLSTQRQSTTNRHLRDICAVINAAIDDELTEKYPFRKFKFTRAETRDKSLSADELRKFFQWDCYDGFQREALDMFILMFCLIGINPVDLANARIVRGGRLEYTRQKTRKPYSIKLEPEALEIINRYAGKDGKLVNILDRFASYKTYFNRLSKTLRKIGLTRVPGKKNVGKAILPDVCLGSARTSWATIAQEELDIDRDTIAAALGHHTVDVTTTYLRTHWKKKIDEANRKVLDFVFYGKLPGKGE